jgi:hypothetical protein
VDAGAEVAEGDDALEEAAGLVGLEVGESLGEGEAAAGREILEGLGGGDKVGEECVENLAGWGG